jgi:hypothetical protein
MRATLGDARRSLEWQALALALVVVYLGVSLHRLGEFPPIHQDEGCIASVAEHLAADGVYGSELFAGYYGAESHYFIVPPLFHFMLAAELRLLPLGMLELRLLPVLFGLAVLLLVGAIGRRIGGPRVATLAMALLVLGPVSALHPHQMGVPLLDLARICRNDLPVAAFGLAALLVFECFEGRASRRAYAIPGALIGLATLSHLYGLIWWLVLLAVLAVRRRRAMLTDGAALWMAAGFVMVMLPWWVEVGLHLDDWLHQARMHSERYQVLDARFYLHNLAGEMHRYDLDRSSPSAWLAVLAVPASLSHVFLRIRRDRSILGTSTFAVACALVVHAVAFALLFASKSRFYVIEVIAPFALLVAETVVALFDRKGARWLVAALLLAFLITGFDRVRAGMSFAQSATPYESYAAKLRAIVPRSGLVLGPNELWLALRDRPYRSWILPLSMTEPGHWHEPISLDQALERVHPELILIDPPIRALFEELRDPQNPRHDKLLGWQAFTARHALHAVGAVDDPTYGKTEVFNVEYEAD